VLESNFEKEEILSKLGMEEERQEFKIKLNKNKDPLGKRLIEKISHFRQIIA